MGGFIEEPRLRTFSTDQDRLQAERAVLNERRVWRKELNAKEEELVFLRQEVEELRSRLQELEPPTRRRFRDCYPVTGEEF